MKRRRRVHANKRSHNEPATATPDSEKGSFSVVGVGASAGGLEAFLELFRQIPPKTGMAFVVIQHLDPTHPSYLREALGRVTPLPISEIVEGMRVAPDHIYVIPSDADIGLLRGAFSLFSRQTTGRGLHLPIDLFFQTLASDRGSHAIGVVLSGTGADGAEGLRVIKAEGGITFAQDPRSAKFAGMPDAAVQTGAVDFALPIGKLAEELLRVSRSPLLGANDAELFRGPDDDGDIRQILILLRNLTKVDFSDYKPASIGRRLARRMALRQLPSLREYIELLREDPSEAGALVEDILIHVTSFFRDEEVFERLKTVVFPEILKAKQETGPIRLWSAGCSTGEEAYSLVIALVELLAERGASDVPILLFGTDVSESVVEKARAGIYPESIAQAVSVERLGRFFTKLDGGGYRINKSIRERCAFVKHDITSDPPFSKLDLVSCRNVLIYFGAELQRRALGTFQFALNQPGYLLLGRAENIVDGTNLFTVVDKPNKIFARTAVQSPLRVAPTREAFLAAASPPGAAARAALPADVVRRAESLLLDTYAPPGVIVNERMEILHFRGRTGPFLEPAPGEPQYNLLKMARSGLIADLRIAVSRAAREQTTVRRADVPIERDRLSPRCDIIVTPVSSPPESAERVFAVLFQEAAQPQGRLETTPSSEPAVDPPLTAVLEEELKSTKEYLQSIIGEHQRTNEELLSSNEELVSSNEELQTLNEELQTAKEELQSTNEELGTLNEELHNQYTELDIVNSDLINVLGNVEVPIVIVDMSRNIRRFTPKARPILNLLPSDVGRPIDDIKPNLAIDELDAKIVEVIDTVAIHEEEVQGRDGRWYRLQIRPYATVEKRIEGAIISVVDIDFLKRALGAAEWARDYARAAVDAVQIPFLILDAELHVKSSNEAFQQTYGLSKAETEGPSLYTIMGGAWDVPEVRSALGRVIKRNELFQKLVIDREFSRLGKRSISLSCRAVGLPNGEPLLLLAAEDITERLRGDAERARLLEVANAATAAAEGANRAKDIFLATLSHELRTPLSTLLMQAELLRRGTMDEARLQRASAAIERATKAQTQLIDDLLDVARIETGKLKVELRKVRLLAVVQAAVDTMEPIAAGKHISIELRADEPQLTVLGDPGRLQQVVINLLTNAVKFTAVHGHVTVTVDSQGERARVRVTDNGIGIAPDFLPHVFSRYTQQDGGQTREGGLGLGLSIVRALVEAHGGAVEVESAGKDRGSTFTAFIPLMAEQASPPSSEAPLSSDSKADCLEGARVLIVDDDQATREALSEMLGFSGMKVRAAGSASQALRMFEDLRPEVIVCDLVMPDQDGYSLLRQLRALGPERGGDTPVLALTALVGEEDRRRALAAGFQAHLAKPVDSDRLIATLQALLGGSKHSPPAAAGGD